jgi:hypothetical protein
VADYPDYASFEEQPESYVGTLYFYFIKSSSNFINILAARMIAWQIFLDSSVMLLHPLLNPLS